MLVGETRMTITQESMKAAIQHWLDTIVMAQGVTVRRVEISPYPTPDMEGKFILYLDPKVTDAPQV